MSTNETEKRFSMRLSEEKLKQVQERAKALGMSINRYLLYAIGQDLKQTGATDLTTTDYVPQRLIINTS